MLLVHIKLCTVSVAAFWCLSAAAAASPFAGFFPRVLLVSSDKLTRKRLKE